MMELCTTVLVCDIADKISKGALERKFLFRVVLLSELAFRLDVPVLFKIVPWLESRVRGP